jgi:hypothetical protein
MVQGLTNPRNIMPAGLGAGRRPPPPGPPTKQPQWGFAPARNRLRDFARISLGRSAPLRGRGPGGMVVVAFLRGVLSGRAVSLSSLYGGGGDGAGVQQSFECGFFSPSPSLGPASRLCYGPFPLLLALYRYFNHHNATTR